jgi:hypothetical protein
MVEEVGTEVNILARCLLNLKSDESITRELISLTNSALRNSSVNSFQPGASTCSSGSTIPLQQGFEIGFTYSDSTHGRNLSICCRQTRPRDMRQVWKIRTEQLRRRAVCLGPSSCTSVPGKALPRIAALRRACSGWRHAFCPHLLWCGAPSARRLRLQHVYQYQPIVAQPRL